MTLTSNKKFKLRILHLEAPSSGTAERTLTQQIREVRENGTRAELNTLLDQLAEARVKSTKPLPGFWSAYNEENDSLGKTIANTPVLGFLTQAFNKDEYSKQKGVSGRAAAKALNNIAKFLGEKPKGEWSSFA